MPFFSDAGKKRDSGGARSRRCSVEKSTPASFSARRLFGSDAPPTASPRPVRLKQHAAPHPPPHNPMLRCGKYMGHSFEHVAAEDRDYYAWILRASDDGKRLPRDLTSFNNFLREHHGGVLSVGKNKAKFFDEVARDDPRYCEWVSDLDDPGGGLKSFAKYLQEQRSAAESAESSGTAGTAETTPSPPPKRRREERPAAQTCSVCYMKPIECAFVPCGHASCCLRCARLVDDADGRCPICRQEIAMTQRIFFSS